MVQKIDFDPFKHHLLMAQHFLINNRERTGGFTIVSAIFEKKNQKKLRKFKK